MADVEEARERLGSTGEKGVLVLLVGLLILATHDKKAAAGTAVVVAGLGLVAGGLVDTALEEMGMKGAL
ncbi:DUF7470 family protein [Halorarius halobius]|uniref:DUF7470 family protein n=1 Tax=Halorarius halobius TaxID=2962671 RepID=UPI0020CF9639|nr:hypothetical protein [Halorarius halobius]